MLTDNAFILIHKEDYYRKDIQEALFSICSFIYDISEDFERKYWFEAIVAITDFENDFTKIEEKIISTKTFIEAYKKEVGFYFYSQILNELDNKLISPKDVDRFIYYYYPFVLLEPKLKKDIFENLINAAFLPFDLADFKSYTNNFLLSVSKSFRESFLIDLINLYPRDWSFGDTSVSDFCYKVTGKYYTKYGKSKSSKIRKKCDNYTPRNRIQEISAKEKQEITEDNEEGFSKTEIIVIAGVSVLIILAVLIVLSFCL